MKKVLVLLVGLLASASLNAAVLPCGDVAPLTYSNAQMQNDGCFFGDKIFSNFTYSGGGDTANFDIAITENQLAAQHTVQLNPISVDWSTDFVITYMISMYAPNMPSPDWSITGVQIDSIVSGSGSTIVKSFGAAPGVTVSSVNGGPSAMTAVLFQQSLVTITATFDVGGDAEVSTVQDNYQQGSAVPEPMTMALFGSGLLAIGLVRRLRKS